MTTLRSLFGSWVLGLSFLSLSCGGYDTEEVEPVAETSEALVVCGANPTDNCYESWSGPNFKAFDLGPGFACAQLYPQPTDTNNVMCFLPKNKTEITNYTPGWGEPISGEVPGGGIKSVAVRVPYRNDASVWVLSNNNVTYGASGNLDNFYGGTSFKNFPVRVPAKDTNGAAECLKKIVNVTLPSIFAPSMTVIGLSCSGKIYTALQNTGWKPAASSGAPWTAIDSTKTWLDISHGPQGAYLLSAAGNVFLFATGTASLSGVTYNPGKWLPSLPHPTGETVKGIAVGGPFVLTDAGDGTCTAPCVGCTATSCSGDAYRVFRWDTASNTWKFPIIYIQGNAGQYPQDGVPWGAIVDGGSFRNEPQSVGLWHIYHRIVVLNPF